ncbi:MAG: TcpE family conjugal transfer membrane protein [Patescibacteria group bacterium]|nr:TcpE family conjugal transfer membrane protein [Patescibacteria group bacterium]
MNFNVPQFIEVEDKIAFQLTAKQLGWFALGGFVLFIVWQFTTGAAFIVIAVVVAAVCAMFAFFKPSGMTLFGFFISGFRYLTRPKIIMWQREVKEEDRIKKDTEGQTGKQQRINRFMKEKALQEADELADILDKQSRI